MIFDVPVSPLITLVDPKSVQCSLVGVSLLFTVVVSVHFKDFPFFYLHYLLFIYGHPSLCCVDLILALVIVIVNQIVNRTRCQVVALPLSSLHSTGVISIDLL
jgi:hypothetical protein